MSKPQPLPGSATTLRTYPSRFKGQPLLVCRKCQRKLKRSGDHTAAANLKKSLKHLARSGTAAQPRIQVIPVSCLKLCPKGAVTVCSQADLRQTPPSLTLIRTRADVAALYSQCTDIAVPTTP